MQINLTLYGIVVKNSKEEIIGVAVNNHYNNDLDFVDVNNVKGYGPILFNTEEEAMKRMKARISKKSYHIDDAVSLQLEEEFGFVFLGSLNFKYGRCFQDIKDFYKVLSVEPIEVSYTV